jgi:zinc protease
MKRLLTTLVAAGALIACATAQPELATSGTTPGQTTVEVEKGAVPAKEAPPASGPPRDIRFPPIERSQTQSGLEVNTVSLEQLPIVHIELIVKSGSAADPSGLPGVAQLTAAMLKEGTRGKSSAKLAEAIDFLGANLHVHNDEENVYINMSALSEHFQQALSLVAEVATRPAFSQSELDKLKTRELARLAMESENPRFLASRELHKALYGEHPYWHVDTTPAVLKRIKRDDLARFHRTHFAPNNAVLIVVGKVDAEQVQTAAQSAFSAWQRRKVPEVAYPAPPERKSREVIIVDREQSVQSVFYIGNLALARGSDDYIPLLVANQVLGGSAASRLFMDLREKRSLTYGAYSFIDERVQVAPFIAYAAVRNEVTGEAMAAFEEHLQRVVAEPPAAQELKDAQAYLVDRFPLRIDTPGKIADLVADLRVHELPDDYWDSFRQQIRAVDTSAAHAAARSYIHGDRSLIVVVGKAADIKPELEKYGPVTVLDTKGELVLSADASAKATDSPAPAKAPAADKPAAGVDNKE